MSVYRRTDCTVASGSRTSRPSGGIQVRARQESETSPSRKEGEVPCDLQTLSLKRGTEAEVKSAKVFIAAAIDIDAVIEAQGPDRKFVANSYAECVAEIAA
jgi:hypothetical protein